MSEADAKIIDNDNLESNNVDEKPVPPTEIIDSGLKLQVGDGIQLELLSDTGQSQHRYLVKIIGYVQNKSILVTTPTIGNKVVLIRVGQLINVRLIAARRLIGFKGNVLRTQFTPYPYLHISYPDKFSSIEIRRSQRVKIHIIAGIQNKKIFGNEPIPVVILDISIGGALIESSRPLGISGDKISIAICLSVAQIEHYILLPAAIKNSQMIEGTTKSATPMYQHGVEFMTMLPEVSLVLHGFVYEQIVNSITG